MISVRGATTIKTDSREEVLSKTKTLLTSILEKNLINIEDIISIVFTATKDIKSVYPAVAARELSITSAALMCLSEMYVENSLEKCIRIMLNAKSNVKQSEIKHVYLEGAEILRPDLKTD